MEGQRSTHYQGNTRRGPALYREERYRCWGYADWDLKKMSPFMKNGSLGTLISRHLPYCTQITCSKTSLLMMKPVFCPISKWTDHKVDIDLINIYMNYSKFSWFTLLRILKTFQEGTFTFKPYLLLLELINIKHWLWFVH